MTESLLESPVYAAGVVAVREHPAVERLQGLLESWPASTGLPESRVRWRMATG